MLHHRTTKTRLRFGFAAAFWLAGIASAFAQQFPTVPARSVIGRIGVIGDTGPSQAIPFANFVALMLTTHAVPNTALAQMPAASFKCNPLAITADVQDCTIQSLVARGAPNANNDRLLIFDNAAGTLKYVTPGLIASAATSGVSSFGGLTGALTAGNGLNCASTTCAVNLQAGSGIAITGTNPLTIASGAAANAFAVNHTIATTDCFNVVQMGTGSTWPLTLTLPAGSPASNGFTGPCPINVVAQASRGVKLSGFSGLGLTSPSLLWPTKSFSLAIASGGTSWMLTGDDGRWAKQNLTINVDSGGSDANDGLATGTTNAIQHLDACRNIAQNYIDTQSSGNGGLTCLAPSGQTFQEFVQVFFPLTGGGTLIFQGSGGAFNWVPANGSYAVQFGDLGVVGFTNVNFTTTGSTSPAGLILGHNYGVADFNTGVTFTASSPAVTTAIDCDYDSHFNFNNGITYTGTFTSFLFRACQNSSWNFNNALNNTGTSTVNRWFNILSGSKVLLNGNVSFVTTGLTVSVGLVSGNAVLNNLSGAAPPGGAPTPTTGGQYCTSLC